MKKYFWGVLLTAALCFPGMIYAQTATEGASVKKLDDVVVTATKTEEKIMDIPIDVQVISSEQIEMSGATNVGDLLGKYVTGHLHRYNGLLTAAGLRGFRTESMGDDVKGKVLILIDGHRVGTGNLAKIPVDNIERIEVIKGPASSLYGAAGMGGVINIITKKGGGDFKTTLKQEVGSFGYQKSSISGTGSLGEKFSYFLSGAYQFMDNYDTPDNGEVYNTEDERKTFSGNLTYCFNENHDIRIGGSYANLEGEYPEWLNYETDTTYDPDYKAAYDKSHQNYDLEYNGSFLDGRIHWKALGYYLWDKNQWYTAADGDDDTYTKYEDDTWGTDQQFAIKLIPKNEIVVGGTYDNLTKEGWGKYEGAETNAYTPNMDYITSAVYLQDSVDLLDNRLNIIAGVRYDLYEVTTKESNTGTYSDFDERTEEFDHISPKIGASYKIYEDLMRVRANVGQGFKAPSAHELSAEYEIWGTQYLGNSDLDPEIATTYEAGFDISHDLVDFGLTYFYTKYEDMIQYASEPVTHEGSEWTTWENVGEATISGFELNVNWRVSRHFDWTPSLSLYSNMSFNTIKEDDEADEDLTYISDYEIKSGLQFGYEKTRATLSNVWIGPQEIDNWDTYVTETKDSFNYWDLTVKQGLFDKWDLDVSITNLFNQDYSWVRGNPMAERTFTVGLSYCF